MRKQITKLFAVAIVATSMISSAMFAEEKTFGEWVEILWQEQNAFYKSNPDLIDIEKGAGIALAAKIKTAIKKGDLTVSGKKYVKAYHNFINGKGKPMIAKWKKEKKLSPKNQAYKYVVQAIHAGHKKVSKSPAAKYFAKGFLHEKFTRKEIDKMRYALVEMVKVHSGMKCDFRDRNWGGVKWENILTRFYPVKLGVKTPDFTTFSYDKYIAKKQIKPSDFKNQLHGYLTPLYLERYKTNFDGFKVIDKNGKKMLEPDLHYGAKENADYAVTMDELSDGVKPTLIFAHTADDTFDHFGDLVTWGMLAPIYKDKINFYHFAQNVIQQDYIMGNNNSMGCKNTVQKESLTYSSADKAASLPLLIKNNYYMRCPFFSKIKSLYENEASTMHVSILPNYNFLFIDKNKVNCAPEISDGQGWRSVYASPLGILQRGWKRKGLKAKIPKTGGYYPLYWIKVNRTIRYLKMMERLNWQYSADDNELQNFFKIHGGISIFEAGRFTIAKGTVKEIDLGKGEIVINGTDDFNKKAPALDHTIQISKNTRTRDKKGGVYSHKIDEIKVGDKVSAVYRYKTDEMKEKEAMVVFKYEKGKVELTARRFFINAKVTAVNLSNGTIQTQVIKPTDWIGYDYWKEAIANGVKEPEGRSGVAYHIGKKILNGTDADRTFNLMLDSGVMFSIDGEVMPVSNIDKVQVGTDIIFSYLMDVKNKKTATYPENVYVINKIK